jgi:putative ABC transport system permease protein
LRFALRDLQWRRRRFAIAIIGTGLVFALTLVLSGLSNGFSTEASRTIAQLRAGGWIVGQGASGPFLGEAPMPASVVDQVAAVPGLHRVGATVFTRKVVDIGATTKDVNVLGAPPGGLGIPATASGRPPATDGEIAISTKLRGFRLGDRLILAGHPFTVVGKVASSTALAGVPNVFLTLKDAQAVAFAGQPVVSAIAYDGTPHGPLPAGLVAMSNAAARADLLRPMNQAHSAIAFLSTLLWLVAAMIVGSLIYLSALERQRDFAVFKATGVSTRSILAGLAFQAVVISLVAALIGGLIAAVLGPNFPIQVSISRDSHLLLPLVAVVVGLVASIAGLRRVAAVEPALAFGGA